MQMSVHLFKLFNQIRKVVCSWGSETFVYKYIFIFWIFI